MDWVFFHTHQKHSLPPSYQPFFLSDSHSLPPPPPPPPLPLPTPSIPSTGGGGGSSFNLDNKISPSILLIIIILAIIFFISGLLHLLVRFLFRPTTRDPDDLDNVTALQGQLQQLFHLHDSGVDQSYIDTLPVFHYKAIIGLKNPFDCAVCLCEFEADDKLRLLPKCSHAFHLECIDTWLLSHSTCPLCRGSLLAEFSPNCSPLVLVLESGSESSREIVADRDGNVASVPSVGTNEIGDSCNEKEEAVVTVMEEKVVSVKLGKFRSVEAMEGKEGEGSSTDKKVDGRRCFSMGSFEYIMDETTSLQVAVKPQVRKQSSKKLSGHGHRAAMSDCDCNSSRFKGFDAFQSNRIQNPGGRSITAGNGDGRSKRESFSISKIWLRTKKAPASSVAGDSLRRTFSFRFPLQRSEMSHELKLKDENVASKRSTNSDMDVSRWENSELGVDEEVGSCVSVDSQASMPSFARTTLQWLMGRQNKVVHSSSNSIV